MKRYFEELDLNKFWSNSEYYTSSEEVNEENIRKAEAFIGYKLPKAYIELIKTKNGGTPINCCFRLLDEEDNYILISGILGIGDEWGIDNEIGGSKFMIEEWGYPNVGVYICQSPSAGHDGVMLDYTHCDEKGEPSIIHVDVEMGEVTYLAPNFESFILGLCTIDEE